MYEVKIFANSEFGAIRTVTDRVNSVWFCGSDVAKALGYERGAKAVADHIDSEDKHDVPIRDSIGRMQNTAFINESGLYSLVLSSKLPTAKKFKRWVTSEVLPSIRKNGGYIAGQENMSDDELMAKALMVAQNKIAERDKQIERMKPKEIFADAVSASHTSILVGDMHDVTAPVFIDNAEAVNEYNLPAMKGQLVLLQVTDDNELKVEREVM